MQAGSFLLFLKIPPVCVLECQYTDTLNSTPSEVLNVYSALYGRAAMLQWYCLCRIRTLFKLLEIHLKSCSQDLKTRGHQSAWFALISMLL